MQTHAREKHAPGQMGTRRNLRKILKTNEDDNMTLKTYEV